MAVAALAASTVLSSWRGQPGPGADGLERERREAYFHASPWPTANCRADNLAGPCELLDECPEDLREWEWHYLMRLCRVEPVVLRDETEVNSVAFSPDGERLASAGGDGTVKSGTARTGKVVQTLRARTRTLSSAWRFTPDGRHLASASADGTVRVWDLTTGQEVFESPVRRGRLHGDGSYAWRSAPTAGTCAAATTGW